MFIILYPIGICSEMWLVYCVIAPSRERNVLYQYLLWFGLSIYVPGMIRLVCDGLLHSLTLVAFYVLFGHMLRQRRKVQQSAKPKEK